MKKVVALFVLPMALFLTGCSAIEEVSDSLGYVTEATSYVDEVNQFAEELPTLAEEAMTDVDAKAQLEELLTNMQAEIEAFDVLEAPAMLEDVHSQVLEYNTELTDGISVFLENINTDTWSADLLSETGLMEEIDVYNDLLGQITELSE